MIVKPDISMSTYLIAVSQTLQALQIFLVIGGFLIIIAAWITAWLFAYKIALRKRDK